MGWFWAVFYACRCLAFGPWALQQSQTLAGIQGALEHWAVVPAMLLVALESHVPILCVSSQAGHNFHNADMSYVKKLCGTFLGGPKLPER